MYAKLLHNYSPTVTPSSSSSIHALRPMSLPIFNHHFTPTKSLYLQEPNKARTFIINCVAANNNSDSVKGGTVNWAELLEKWSPKNFLGADKFFRAISNATSSPIAQYIPSPFTFLHSVDPRIKLAWLVTLVILPAKSNVIMRLSLVVYLAILSILVQPAQVWKDHLGRVTLLSGFLFIMLSLGADSAPSLISSRAPPPSLMGLPPFPASLEGYKYVILKLGPLQVTRKGLSTATTSACLTFTIFQSASVFLSTTTPEQIAFALRWFISPFANVGVPVAEVILTLLLSLRFINLVFDEVRNVALGIVSRRINWQELTMLETVDVFVTYIRRIFRNIFVHAEQISQAMIVRGFRGDSTTHKIFLSADSSNGVANYISIAFLCGLIALVTLPRYLVQ